MQKKKRKINAQRKYSESKKKKTQQQQQQKVAKLSQSSFCVSYLLLGRGPGLKSGWYPDSVEESSVFIFKCLSIGVSVSGAWACGHSRPRHWYPVRSWPVKVLWMLPQSLWVHTCTSPDVHGTGRYSVLYQRRKLNTHPAANPWIYNGDHYILMQ